MGTEEEDEDFVFYGTPIEREEEISVRKRKTTADSGSLRSLPSWKQEVRDEEGRRRLHGAFTGGFSAGYYNTVGSKEGWTPQTFSSSRKNRAEVKKQSIYSFLDEEDIKDMGGQGLETSLKFDTFGFTAAEHARKLAEKEQKSRPSAIPGPVPDEILVPVTSSIGIKLLLKMGWRRGHSIKETQANSLNEKVAQTDIASSNAGEPTQMGDDTLFSSKTTPGYVINPKQDLYGLGFDPFKHAPEFRDRKASMARNDHLGSKRVNSMIGNLFGSNSGKYAPGFGIGALEELDVEDEDIYASGLELAGNEVQEDDISRIVVDGKLRLGNSQKGILHGFKVALKSDYSLERFDPPTFRLTIHLIISFHPRLRLWTSFWSQHHQKSLLQMMTT
ncbi:hypothetical protein HPP92_002785 [Vanilla planifolia]|uniref:G patch domain-containing protein n=1 Tax=Vanilla planifolia TaxID=51239 RepID=A0A835SFC8_VANPL|nr:hypothetical protein HPP92_002785 [Vanilla planifolia]